MRRLFLSFIPLKTSGHLMTAYIERAARAEFWEKTEWGGEGRGGWAQFQIHANWLFNSTLWLPMPLLTVPRHVCESSKNVVSTFHNGDRGSFVITSGVKGCSCEAISRRPEQKTETVFTFPRRQPS